jgi:microcin C transport system substrate-binding protein
MRLTRRTVLRTGAAALAAPAVGDDSAFARSFRRHLRRLEARLIAVRRPEISPDFRQFDYVSADAPKGGAVRRMAFGTFDSFNLVVAG